jgi:hypothetical protein
LRDGILEHNEIFELLGLEYNDSRDPRLDEYLIKLLETYKRTAVVLGKRKPYHLIPASTTDFNLDLNGSHSATSKI